MTHRMPTCLRRLAGRGTPAASTPCWPRLAHPLVPALSNARSNALTDALAHPLAGVAAMAMAALAGAASAQAPGTATAPARIERVTLYPGLAEVERVARVAAGTRELVLPCLSGRFDPASLRLEGDGGVRIGPVTTTTRAREAAPECRTSPLDQRIKALEDRLALLGAESAGHDIALGYLRALAPADAASASMGLPRAAPAPAALAATVQALQRSAQASLAEQHRIAREREALERELAPLRTERDRAVESIAQWQQVRIALAAPRDGTVRVRYQVRGPTWAPAYRAVLDVPGRAVEVERLAHVVQASGEDWPGVALRLSTGSPQQATTGPQPRPWQVSPRPALPPSPAPMPAPVAMARAAAPMAEAAAAPPTDAAAALEFRVQVAQGEFATEFDVPGRVDVASGGQQVALALGSVRLPATVKVQATPALDASAWLVADVVRPAGVWPEGRVQLVRGNEVVGTSVWRDARRPTLTLPFGRDERVRVQVNDVPAQTATTGFIGTRAERRIVHDYTVENRHDTAIDIDVLEATPVATDEQITVARQFTPPPRDGWWDDRAGVVVWPLKLAPGASKGLRAQYVISHPKDLAVVERR